MDAERFDITVNGYRDLRPFHPFTIVLTSGKQLECDFPNAILARDGLGMHAGPGGIPTIFDHGAVDHIRGDLSDADLERAAGGGES